MVKPSSAEAKAAYLLAEEEFSAGRFSGAISYLDQAATKLGGANAKILYLKIMALQTLAEDDDTNTDALRKAIAAFVKAPDYTSFNEEKQLEVMKLKLRLEKEAVSGKPVDPVLAGAYTQFGLQGWQVGAKLEDMKKVHPAFFEKASRQVLKDTLVTYSLAEANGGNIVILATKGIVIYITKTLLSFQKDDASFSIGRGRLAAIKNHLGSSFVETSVEPYNSPPSKWSTSSTIGTTCTWKGKKYLVTATLVNSKSKNYKQPEDYTSRLIVSVHYTPTQSGNQ